MDPQLLDNAKEVPQASDNAFDLVALAWLLTPLLTWSPQEMQNVRLKIAMK
jgi:hypothetical protein